MTAWKDRAACEGHPPEWWYPAGTQGVAWNAEHEYLLARTVCDGCPVKDHCLRWALDNDECHGMWGGLTPTERDRLHGGRRRPVPDVDVGLPPEARQCETCTDTAIRGETMCTRCMIASGIEWDRGHRKRALNASHKRSLRERRLDAGLCQSCGVEPHRPRRTNCQGCADRQLARERRRRANRLGVAVSDLIQGGNAA